VKQTTRQKLHKTDQTDSQRCLLYSKPSAKEKKSLKVKPRDEPQTRQAEAVKEVVKANSQFNIDLN